MNKDVTTQLYWAIEENEVLDISNTVNIEDFSDDMDGVFSRVCDWTRFANKINKDGISVWFEKNAKYYGINKIKELSYDTYEIEFSEPIEILLATIWDRQVIEKVSTIRASISYEWYFMQQGRQDEIANWIEIFMSDIGLIK